MVAKNPFQLSVIADCFGILAATFYRWYKEFLSDFRTDKEQHTLHQHDILIKKINNNEGQNILVPILIPENMGESMAIDEKHINNIFYTVLTNAITGKVALMINSMNPKYVGQTLLKFAHKLKMVKIITRDLSPTFKSIADQFFPNAIQVADKYHIIAYATDAVQDLRTKYRQENASRERKLQAQHLIKYKEYKLKLTAKTTENLIKVSKIWHPEKLRNGETIAEILARSRYLLFKKPEKWNDYQRSRSEILFEKFPLLKEAFELINDFRNWYEPNEIKDSNWNYLTAETQLMHWMDLAESSKTEEILNFRALLERHFQPILNYHLQYKTNAIAESVNAKIKTALTNNKGARDLDFFHFRLKMIL
ncbi:MAG: transposase [Bacteroidota bacterium]|nr:transposase [Bacteroidota bacterium]